MFSISKPPFAWREFISVQKSSRNDADGSSNDFFSVSNEDCEKSILLRLHGQSRISVALCLFCGSKDPQIQKLTGLAIAQLSFVNQLSASRGAS